MANIRNIVFTSYYKVLLFRRAVYVFLIFFYVLPLCLVNKVEYIYITTHKNHPHETSSLSLYFCLATVHAILTCISVHLY